MFELGSDSALSKMNARSWAEITAGTQAEKLPMISHPRQLYAEQKAQVHHRKVPKKPTDLNPVTSKYMDPVKVRVKQSKHTARRCSARRAAWPACPSAGLASSRKRSTRPAHICPPRFPPLCRT